MPPDSESGQNRNFARELAEQIIGGAEAGTLGSEADQAIIAAVGVDCLAHMIRTGDLFQTQSRQQAVWKAFTARRLPLEPEERSERMAQVGLGVFLGRHEALVSLGDPTSPLQRQPALARQLVQVVEWLESERLALLQTGFPTTSCPTSPWLIGCLGRHYYTRIPLLVEATVAEEGPASYRYHWPDVPAQPRQEMGDWRPGVDVNHFLWEDDQPTDGQGQQVRIVPYAESALIHGLDPDDAAFLDGIRKLFWALKLATLRQLAQMLAASQMGDCWSECLPLFHQHVTYDQAQRLLGLDRFYRGFGQLMHVESKGLANDPTLRVVGQTCGGLSDLLDVIIHCQLEQDLGVWDLAAKGLRRLGGRLGCSDWWTLCTGDYTRAIGEPWQGELDLILDQFMTRNRQGQELQEELRQRLNADLERELDQEVRLTVRIKRRLAPQYESFAHDLLDTAKHITTMTGEVPELTLRGVTSGREPAEPTWIREGDYWGVQFEGRSIQLKNTKGMRYLYRLISQPGHEFTALELYQTENAKAKGGAASGSTIADLGQGYFFADGPAEVVLDRAGLAKCRDAVEELEADVETARNQGASERALELQDDLERVRRLLATAQAQGGQSRRFTGASEPSPSFCAHSAIATPDVALLHGT